MYLHVSISPAPPGLSEHYSAPVFQRQPLHHAVMQGHMRPMKLCITVLTTALQPYFGAKMLHFAFGPVNTRNWGHRGSVACRHDGLEKRDNEYGTSATLDTAVVFLRHPVHQ